MALLCLKGLSIGVLATVLLVSAEAYSNNAALFSHDPLVLAYHASTNMAHRVAKRSTHTCDLMTLAPKYMQCGLMSLSSGITMDSLDDFCTNMECKLQCATDVAGNCYRQDVMFAWEPAPNIVLGRAICENKQLTLSMIECLVGKSSQCFLDLVNTLKRELIPLILHGQYDEYRLKYCKLTRRFQACLNYDGCPRREAEFGRMLWSSGMSFSKCGYSQDNMFFAKYGGAPKCGGRTESPTIKTPEKYGKSDGFQKQIEKQSIYQKYSYNDGAMSTSDANRFFQGIWYVLPLAMLSTILNYM